MSQTVIIGVAGGTGSGKTTVVREIVVSLGADQVTLIEHDSYYKDHADLSFEERAALNFDHPDSLETELLVEHLARLRSRKAVEIPIYDFAEHRRKEETKRLQPSKAIIVEGILVLADRGLREQMDIKVFVDTDADIRFIRRMQRDLNERGRTMESVVNQYLTTVKASHEDFVEPSKRHADIIIPEGGHNAVAVDMLLTKIRSVVGRKPAVG